MDNTSNMFIWNKEEFTELVKIREVYKIKKMDTEKEEMIMMCQWKKKAGLNNTAYNEDLSFFMSIGNIDDTLLDNKRVLSLESTESNIINVDIRNIAANEYIDIAIDHKRNNNNKTKWENKKDVRSERSTR